MKKLLLLSLLLYMPSYAEQEVYEDPFYYGEGDKEILIRWGFQKFCDFVFDPRTNQWVWPTNSKKGVTFDPKKVKLGSTIFVRDVELFFRKMHPHIEHPYIMVTHGEHVDKVRKSHLDYLDDNKVIAWFGIHPCKVTHPKFFSIPIGVLQQPDNYYKRGSLHNFFTRIRATSEKKNLLYMNFADWQKPERKYLRSLLAKEPYCKRGERQPFHSYIKEMAQCKFTLSPKGLGPDCYRNWEALLAGSFPIVRSSQVDPLFEGLPVLIIDDWDVINEEFLNKKYKEMRSQKYDLSRLYLHYWTDKIIEVRDQFLDKRSS